MLPILKWQYDQITKEFLLLQEHLADPSCPCETGGEMCVRKHLMTIEAYAQETVAIEDDENYQEKLNQLAIEAQTYRKREEAALRGEEDHASLIEWSRNWRKEFEEYSVMANISQDNHHQESSPPPN